MLLLTNATWLRYYMKMSAIDSLINKLREKKLRKTKLRIFILKSMLNSPEPLSAEDLLGHLLKNKFQAHKTSVYRQLSALQKEKIIKEIQLGENKKRYEIYPNNHHHHFVCVDCGHIEDVESEKDLDNLESKITRERKIKIVNHSLEFFGHCANCNSK